MPDLRAATRGSPLALWQTRHVAALLGRGVEEIEVSTVGDRNTDVPIHSMGGKGVFVKEVQAAVLDGRADFAVHSAKDLPAVTPDGLVLVAVPTRADARDALVGSSWADHTLGAHLA
ncbi:MAG: hydroxymethylbilane synthase, partial [Ilumatobacteraceae bacterium]